MIETGSLPAPAAPTIYIVDDDAAVRDSIRSLLECEHLHGREFGSCEEVLAARGPWDAACLILDVNLPSMNGLDFLEGLRARGFAGPVIMVTGNPDPVMRRRAAEAGANLLEKPFAHRDLLELVRKSVAAGGAGSA